MTIGSRFAVVVLAGLVLSPGLRGQQDSVVRYTEAQAEHGRAEYDTRCAGCHGGGLTGGGNVPSLVGERFMGAWGRKPVRDLIDYVRQNMPPGAPMPLDEPVALGISAYMLQKNGLPSGQMALQSSATATLVPGGAPSHAPPSSDPDLPTVKGEGVAVFVQLYRNTTVPSYSPVTEAMLRNPPPGDWLIWRRTLDSQGYSPLTQITSANVKNLRLAWVLAMEDGMNEPTPLVHDGVLFVAHPDNRVQALNAASGDLIWEYRYPVRRAAITRNIALYGTRVFALMNDGMLVALDARTGKEAWKTPRRVTSSSGPVVADGVVISPGAVLTGHDAETGKELWRLNPVAQPGDPNEKTWGSLPRDKRGGIQIWIPGSYDPQLKLFYFGTSQAKPWVPISRGMTPLDAALYQNATIAIDPKTGRMAWYFQHAPGDPLDLDISFERVLVDVDGRPTLFTIGKDGLLWKLDRKTGAYIDVTTTVYNNVYDHIDKKTGRVSWRPDIIEAKFGEWIAGCPGTYGGKDWPAMSYVPESHAMIMPLSQACLEMKATGGAGASGVGAELRYFEMPGSDGKIARLAAYDVRTMQELWHTDQRAMLTSAVVSTAGGVTFVGDIDRYFKAFDSKTGQQLWQTRLGKAVHGFPVTYAVGGKQYVAVGAGLGFYRTATGVLHPDIYQPEAGNALYVFELPE